MSMTRDMGEYKSNVIGQHENVQPENVTYQFRKWGMIDRELNL